MRTTSPARTCRVDERGGRVGDLVADLDAAVHRARVHDELAGPQARGVMP